jgi:hypothetical protein
VNTSKRIEATVVGWRAFVEGMRSVTDVGRIGLLLFGAHQDHQLSMLRLRFDDTDYSVVVKNRGTPPNSWRWEIYRAGRSNPIRQSPVLFRSIVAANKAGKAALKELLAKLNTQPSRPEA